MPTYDYRCRACEHEFEEFQSMSAKTLRKCPECGKLKLERLIGTGAGIIFKGSGFYETDYRSEGYKKAAESEKKSSEPKSEPKSDAKPEKKAEKKTETGKKE
ncbi:MAG: zinc ribbon domain-containing protein [Phycisphaerales bacterium]